jgi:hypothetical protein
MSQDHFVLFRDTAVPTPTDIEYKKRADREDVLISDRALYVWGYVGALNDRQAEIVKKGLDFYVDERLKLEHEYLVPSLGSLPCEIAGQRRTYKITVIPHEPASRDFLAQVSPNLVFFSHVPLHQQVRIYPESTTEKRWIFQTLQKRSVQKRHGFEFCLWNNEQEDFEPHKRHRSFVELLSLETLMDIWNRFGYFQHMDLLRRTAGIWVLETLEKNCNIHTKRNSYRPGMTRLFFKSIVLNDKKYIPTLTLRQQVVLGKCVDIANSIRIADGCETKNIENIYRVLLEKSSQAEKTEHDTRKNREAKYAECWVKKVECEAMGAKYEAMKAKYEAMVAECEAMNLVCSSKKGTKINDDSAFLSLTQAANGKGNPISAIDAYNESIARKDEPAGTRTIEYSEKALEQRLVGMKPLITAIDDLPGKIGSELQDAWAKWNDPPDETELDYARRLRRTTANTYEEIAALVGERFPDGKYAAGDGENIRKALNPPKKKG